MASHISHHRALPLFITEMNSATSRLSPANGMIRDVALYIIAPLLIPRLNGYEHPGVFEVHPEQRKKTVAVTLKTARELSCNGDEAKTSITDLLIDKLGRTLLINHQNDCLTILSEGEAVKKSNTPEKNSSSLFQNYGNAVISSKGDIYVLDFYKKAVAHFSQEGEFVEYLNIAPMPVPTCLAIDNDDFLYISQPATWNRYDKICKYTLEGRYICDLGLKPRHNFVNMHYDPVTNRLYLLEHDTLSYYCLRTETHHHHLNFSSVSLRKPYIRIDTSGNLYLSDCQGSLLLYDKEDTNPTKLSLESQEKCSPFCLDKRGKILFFSNDKGMLKSQ